MKEEMKEIKEIKDMCKQLIDECISYGISCNVGKKLSVMWTMNTDEKEVLSDLVGFSYMGFTLKKSTLDDAVVIERTE
jgi:hypothetical protein